MSVFLELCFCHVTNDLDFCYMRFSSIFKDKKAWDFLASSIISLLYILIFLDLKQQQWLLNLDMADRLHLWLPFLAEEKQESF